MILMTLTTIDILFLVLFGFFIISIISFLLIKSAQQKNEKLIDNLSVEFTASDRKSELNVKQNFDKEIPVVEEVKEEVQPEEIIESVEMIEPEYEQIDSQEYEEIEGTNSELEILLNQMGIDLEKHKNDPVGTFEEEQEEKSIISYQELKAIKDSDRVEIDENEEQPISISEVEKKINNVELQEKSPRKEQPVVQTFATSEFISPIYGKIDTANLDYPKIHNFQEDYVSNDDEDISVDDLQNMRQDVRHTFNEKSVLKDSMKSEEFLEALKDFRNNLE